MLSFEYLFTVPLSFICQFVKNKSEAALLLEIARLGTQLNILVKYYISTCQQGELFERIWLSFGSAIHPLTNCLAPILAHLHSIHAENLRRISTEFTNILGKLKNAYGSLQQYVESNYSLFHELSATNLTTLANDKLQLAQAEELLASRMKSLFEGDMPYKVR